MESDPTAVLAFDVSNAFNSLPRERVLTAILSKALALATISEAWLSSRITHFFWNSTGAAMPAHATSCVDQGCPLLPAFFAIALDDTLNRIRNRLQVLDRPACVFSYLDDIMVVVPCNTGQIGLRIDVPMDS